MKRTKIVATVGPASDSREMLEKMMHAGVDVFRLNFSHGTQQYHEEVLKKIRAISQKLKKNIAIMQDLCGPKIRIGQIQGGEILLKPRQKITITTREVIGSPEIISTTYKGLPHDAAKGDKILLDDGLIMLRALNSEGDRIICEVIQGGILKEHKGINLPGGKISAGALTRKDIDDLRFGLALGVDAVAISFVRSAEDIAKVRAEIKKAGADVLVIAKIERPEAIKNLKEILAASDGIMVARGDLGVEMPAEQVPVLQKQMIRMANEQGKVVITATQMLESMVNTPRPTRAEANDVANAVFDGTDAVMLSAETAVGKYPVESVEMMSRILKTAEKEMLKLGTRSSGLGTRGFPIYEPRTMNHGLWHIGGFSGVVAEAACRMGMELHTQAIVTFSQSGTTALLASKYRPTCPLIGATLNERIARRMCLYWGVIPVVFKKVLNTESVVDGVEKRLLQKKLAKKKDLVIITSGVPVGVSGTTNLLKIHRMGERD